MCKLKIEGCIFLQYNPIFKNKSSTQQRGETNHIQKLLGHRSSKTTEIYTYVCTTNLKDITSP